MRFVPVLAATALAAVVPAQFNAVMPDGYGAVEGNTNNAYPWNRGSSSMRIQFVYDSTNFTAQGVLTPILIQSVRYRPNATTTSWAGGSWPNVTIEMATCTSDYQTPNTTFAANMGPDLTLVHQGAVVVQPGVGLGTTVVHPWHIDIPFATPFLYDPNSGDLVIDIQLDGSGWSGTSTQADHVSSTGNPPPLGTRIYNTTSATATTGTIGVNYTAVCEFGYVPATGLHPAFSATPLAGPIGTTVQFTDQSYSSAPGGVLAWQWDFNGDSVVDSTLQNPTFQYQAGGNYDVTLAVIDGFGAQSLTKPDYIGIALVQASFTTQTFGSTVVFTDTSANNPITWAWDFQNDGIVDSTQQNPAFTYPGPGSYECKLTVTNAYSTDTTIVNLGLGIVPVPPFGNTYSVATATRGFWFQAPTRFSVVSMQVPDESNHGMQNVALYRLAAAPPVYAANATGGLEFYSTLQPSTAPIPCAVSFDTGEFVGVLGACGDASTSRNSYALPAGPFASSVLGVPTTLTRMLTQFNLVTSGGTAAYSQEPGGQLSRVILGVSAAVGLQYGAGTPSPFAAAPELKTTALPLLGANAQLTLTNHDAQAIGILAVGIGRLAAPTPIGTLLIDNFAGSDVVNGGAVLAPGNYTYSFAIPNNPALQGYGPVNWQAASLVLPSGVFAMSNATEWWLAQ